MKVLTVLGVRPQFIKAAVVSRVLRKYHTEIIVHTGQHNDNMSEVFFRELNIPQPDYKLSVGSGSHGVQTGKMLAAVEDVIVKVKPSWVLVYGDTNSTLAGALAAVKLHIPVLHVEAGLRSNNRDMPEEINRVITDSISTLLACPTTAAVNNLKAEGHMNLYKDGALMSLGSCPIPLYSPENPLVANTGDVMYDTVLYNLEFARRRKSFPYLRNKERYILATVHRAENTDDKEHLEGILRGLASLGRKIVMPLHPRTKKSATKFGLNNILDSVNLNILEPIGYLDMLLLMDNADMIVTDSGGVQKEAFILGKPCVTLRCETEWQETVETGWNALCGLGGRDLYKFKGLTPPKGNRPMPYGDGNAAEKIVSLLI